MSKRSPARSPYGRRWSRSKASFCSSVTKFVHAGIKADDSIHLKPPRSLKSGVLKGSQTSVVVRKKQASPLHIRWTCPPKFILNYDWRVAAGEQSEERRVQEQRESGVTDLIHSHPSAVPVCQSISFDDDNIPIIPITPIEDGEADSIHEITPPSFLKEKLKSELFNGVETSDLTQHSSQQDISVTSLKPNGEKHPIGTLLTGLDADIGAAASAAFTALVKSNEQGSLIDTDLLIKILNDPKMIELLRIPLSLGNDKATTLQDEALVAICSSSPSNPEQENLYLMQPDTDRDIISEILAPKHVHSDKLFKQVHKASDPMVISEPPLPPKQEEPSNCYTISRPTNPSFLATLTSSGSPAELNRHVVSEILAPKHSIHSEKLPKQGHSTTSRPLTLPGDKSKLQVDRDHIYYKSLVRQHGHERRDKEQRIKKVHDAFRKTCIYFNSPKGCRLGLNCLYRHQDINQAHRVSEAPMAKRVKHSSKIILRL